MGRSAVWYSVEDISPYEDGQLIRIESEFMMERYPAQSEALRVQIVQK
ncbi:DUF3221 domain-containing protein [Halalkalibacter lacteus]